MKFVPIPITSTSEYRAMANLGLDFCDGCGGRFHLTRLKEAQLETREGFLRAGLACGSCRRVIAQESKRAADLSSSLKAAPNIGILSTRKRRVTSEKGCPMATLEERLNTLAHDYEVFIREQGQDMREMKARLTMVDTRLATMDARLGMVDTRLNRLEEKIDALDESVSEDIGSLREEMNRKFDQVLALLTHGNPGT